MSLPTDTTNAIRSRNHSSMNVVTNDLLDDFYYEIAIALRRILDLGEIDEYEETDTAD